MTYYIEMYYVDKVKSRAIAIKFLHMANEHDYVREYYKNNTTYIKSNFSFVLTDKELEELSGSPSLSWMVQLGAQF
jgi:hypothetical protein